MPLHTLRGDLEEFIPIEGFTPMLRRIWRRRQDPPSDDGYCYLFLHIPKCAGTSIINRLSLLGRQGVHLFEECRDKGEARRLFRRKLAAQNLRPSEVRAIYGHRVFANLADEVARPARFVFFMREPASMVVSNYNYYVTMALDENHPRHSLRRAQMIKPDGALIGFDDWLEHVAPRNMSMNSLYHAVAGDKAPGYAGQAYSARELAVCNAAIEQAHFVGLCDSIERDGPRLLRMIGLDDQMVHMNVSRKAFRLGDDMALRKRIEQLNSFDCELYRHAVYWRHRNGDAAVAA